MDYMGLMLRWNGSDDGSRALAGALGVPHRSCDSASAGQAAPVTIGASVDVRHGLKEDAGWQQEG